VLAAIDTLAKKIRAPAKRKSLAGLRNYIVARLELLNYPLALARGYDIGSGPTEAMCKTLTQLPQFAAEKKFPGRQSAMAGSHRIRNRQKPM
jgi:hypothetical protein